MESCIKSEIAALIADKIKEYSEEVFEPVESITNYTAMNLLVNKNSVELRMDVMHGDEWKIFNIRSGVHAMADVFENFKEEYKTTRNYTLLSDVQGYSDLAIFRDVVSGGGFSCVISAWEMYLKGLGLECRHEPTTTSV